MIENSVLEEIVPQLVTELVDRVVKKREDLESSVDMIMKFNPIINAGFTREDRDLIEGMIRAKFLEASAERARLSASSGKATGFAGGRYISKPRRDFLTEREDKNDEIHGEFPQSQERVS